MTLGTETELDKLANTSWRKSITSGNLQDPTKDVGGLVVIQGCNIFVCKVLRCVLSKGVESLALNGHLEKLAKT